MPQLKLALRLAALLTLTLTVFSSPPVLALTGSAIAVTPGFTKGAVPSTFVVSITLANVSSLIAYDVVIQYNQTVLNAVHVSGGNVFACITASPPCGSGVITLANSTTQTTGTVEVSQALLSCATCSGTTSVTNATLFSVTFAFQNFGSSPITISRAAMTGIVNGVISVLPTPAIVNGVAVTPPPASASFIKKGLAVAFHHLSIPRDGNVQTISADVSNTGTTVAFVKISYTITSAAGSVSSVSSVVLQMSAGATTTISTSYTVAPLPVRYFVFALLLVSGDGTLYTFSGTDTVSYAVVS